MGTFRIFLESAAEKEVETLLQAVLPGTEFAGKVYSVGGYVRDELLGKKSKDLDIVIELDGGAKKITHYIHNLFSKETSRPLQLGAGYPIWHLAFKLDVVHSGRIYKTAGAEVDFADTQTESFPDPESRQRTTKYGSLDLDIRRRDLTINMLLRDLTSGEIVDLTGVSKSDLEKGILRGHPDVPWDRMFADDPLRMLRLVRFQVKYGFQVPMAMLKTVRRNAKRIRIISAERIRDELIKIMDMGKLDRALRLMKSVGLLGLIFPEIDILKGVEQGELHHAEGAVLTHTLMVLRNSKKGIIPQLAALLHDVGKEQTREEEGGKVSFTKHEIVSGSIAERILRRLKFDTNTIKKVRKIVEFHMRPHNLGRQGGTKAIRKFIRDAGEEMEEILDLCSADERGKIPSVNDVPALREKIKKVLDSPIPVRRKPILNGKEIMDLLGLKPGPKVGEVGQFLIELEDDYADREQELKKGQARQEVLRAFGS